MATTSGFGPKATRFFQDLEDDNSREFWTAHADIYEREVKQPMTELLESLPERYQPFRLFRMNRDLRFTKDRSPYKTHLGAISDAGGKDYYLHLSGTGLLVAAGMYMMDPDQLERYRSAVDDDRSGQALERILADLEARSVKTHDIGMPTLKSAPRGYAKDHPRIELLRQKGLVGYRTLTGGKLRSGDGVRNFVVETFEACGPLVAWLGEHVGAPAERSGPGR
jgi:uncharacterized protein (TIGR02453 family)